MKNNPIRLDKSGTFVVASEGKGDVAGDFGHWSAQAIDSTFGQNYYL